MTIKIVTDSTCDLPPAIVANYDITVVPLYINIGTNSYLDGVDLSRHEFYENLPHYAALPTTAAPGAGTFQQTYQHVAAAGADHIISIHVSGSLSATLDNARLGARQTSGVQVTVFDSQQISLGVGFLALTAAKAAAEGQTVAEIIPLLNHQINRTYLLGVLDTLNYLQRSGRARRVVAGLGSLLQIKPVFKLHNGQVSSERVRTRKRAIARLVDRLDNLAPFSQLGFIHSHAPERATALKQHIEHLLPQPDPLQIEITPILGAHLGPGGVGVVVIAAG